jgi:hypothetical protein
MQCISTPNNVSQTQEVYLDANNDGSFDSAERVATTNVVGSTTSLLRFTVPLTASLGLLRLRLIAYKTGSTAPDCANVTDGQAEDYGLLVTPFVAIQPTQTLSLTLAPNPATHEVRLEGTLPSSANSTLTLIDALGRVVLTRTTTGNTLSENISVDNLPTGVYQVLLQQGASRTLKRLVVER